MLTFLFEIRFFSSSFWFLDNLVSKFVHFWFFSEKFINILVKLSYERSRNHLLKDIFLKLTHSLNEHINRFFTKWLKYFTVNKLRNSFYQFSYYIRLSGKVKINYYLSKISLCHNKSEFEFEDGKEISKQVFHLKQDHIKLYKEMNSIIRLIRNKRNAEEIFSKVKLFMNFLPPLIFCTMFYNFDTIINVKLWGDK